MGQRLLQSTRYIRYNQAKSLSGCHDWGPHPREQGGSGQFDTNKYREWDYYESVGGGGGSKHGVQQTIQCASQVSQSVSTPASGLKLGLHPFRIVLGSPRLAHGWPDGQTARLKDKQSDEEHAPAARGRTSGPSCDLSPAGGPPAPKDQIILLCRLRLS